MQEKLTQDTITQEINDAIAALRDEKDSEPCEDLIRIRGVQSPAFASAAFALDIFYPYILYQDASPKLRDQIIDLLENAEAKERENIRYYHLLQALAMIGDDTAVKAIRNWQEHPRPWCEELSGGPLAHVEGAGWCVEADRTGDVSKRQLFFNACYALEKSETAAPGESVFGGTCDEICPACGCSYINVVLDGSDERLSFLELHGKIKIKYCESCVPWAQGMFCRYEEDKESTVILQEGEAGPFFDDADLNSRPPFVLSKKMVPTSYCDEFDRCAVGGKPAFLYGAGYLNCPECGRVMMHLAQLGSTWTDCGTHYIQICRDCKIAGVTYQQT
ncbi:MAG: hypothetical protein K2P39_04340 [Lachnospiraceae bacterium]|nr:hypothetical protein [Lachnospiraceae bacterium]